MTTLEELNTILERIVKHQHTDYQNDSCKSSNRLTREKADAQTEEHLGFHLALLWEDPHRLTPNVMLELKTPGQ
ncbi:hypothetical protein [uncultured Nostoc sp.]|uniref:hypothetical protein n=1 Tax=uncultured Nostoc sp. TaxID=340711 RepID=UPI0035CC440E